MATDPASLLPPNATRLERALEAATARLGDVPLPITDLWNPATCPPDLLPWLAWALSIDRWDAGWPEARKREAVAAAIEMQRRKGTPATVDAVVRSFDSLMYVVEWFEATPPRAPHTFDIIMPVLDYVGPPLDAAVIDQIVREVVKVKPVRAHFTLVQSLPATTDLGVVAAASGTGFDRLPAAAFSDTSPAWATYLQTEDGEPLQLEDRSYLQEESA